jgi:iron donor protein CyaY
MIDEQDFRRAAESALDSLKRHLIAREEEDDAGFEVEEQQGVLNVVFEEPPGKFVITPNTPVRQIWISALATSFKLEWNATQGFILPRTNEQLTPLVDRLIHERHGGKQGLGSGD